MLEFIYDLYKTDNFTLYLTIILVVLIIAFFVVLFLGKKDQKLEETKRLEKIDLYSFKEEDSEPIKAEVKANDALKDVPQEKVEVTEFNPHEEEKMTFSPSTDIPKKKENKLFTIEDTSIEDIPEIKFDDKELEKDLQELESITKKFAEIKQQSNVEIPKEPAMPVFQTEPTIPEEPKEVKPIFEQDKEPDFDKMFEQTMPPKEVFSSVYVGNDASKTVTPSSVPIYAEEDDEEIDLPSLK